MHGIAITRCSDVRVLDEGGLQSKHWSAVFLLGGTAAVCVTRRNGLAVFE